MIYKSMVDSEGNEMAGKVMLFVTVDEDGKIQSITKDEKIIGVSKTGFTFVADKEVYDQIDKFEIKDCTLKIKDGEKYEKPDLTDLEKQELELERQLAELRNKKETE